MISLKSNISEYLKNNNLTNLKYNERSTVIYGDVGLKYNEIILPYEIVELFLQDKIIESIMSEYKIDLKEKALELWLKTGSGYKYNLIDSIFEEYNVYGTILKPMTECIVEVKIIYAECTYKTYASSGVMNRMGFDLDGDIVMIGDKFKFEKK